MLQTAETNRPCCQPNGGTEPCFALSCDLDRVELKYQYESESRMPPANPIISTIQTPTSD